MIASRLLPSNASTSRFARLRRRPSEDDAASEAFGTPGPRWVSPTGHICGLAVFVFGTGMVLCGVVGAAYGDSEAHVLLLYGGVCAVAGAFLWRRSGVPERMSRLAAFYTVTVTWMFVAAVGAVPYLLAGTFDSVVNAWFESVSGLTTVGSTVLADIEGQGKGILLYRQFTQFFGGGGIVLLAVAILQSLGVGGLELADGEVPGSASEGRIAPRVAIVARRLWSVYVGMVAAVALALVIIGGVGPYDAVAHAMTTIATAGFSTFDDSIAHFDSAVVEAIFIVGMILGAVNFSLHYRALRAGGARYLASPEFRFYMTVLVGAVAVVTVLVATDGMPLTQALRESSFNVVTVATTTGYGTSDFTTWLPGAQMILLGLMFVGGMAGSTSGGFKMIRLRVLMKFAWREVKRVRHPRGVFVIRLGNQTVAERAVRDIAAFALLYVVAITSATVVLAFLGTDFMTSLGAVGATLSTVGPGLGEAGPHSNFLVFSEPARVVLSFLMLLGRMELLAFLLAFVVPYRRLKRAVQAVRFD